MRFILKSFGYQVSNPASERFHKTVGADIVQSCRKLIEPLIATLEAVAAQIKELERAIMRLATQRYPHAVRLQEIAGALGACGTFSLCLKRDQRDADKELH